MNLCIINSVLGVTELLVLACVQLKPVRIGRLCEINSDVDSTHCSVSTPESSSANNSVSSLLSKLITGQLIYPWMELTSKTEIQTD